MRVLIVGAGSIGQLYGFMLQRGGAEVEVYVRPRYVDDAQRGYRIYERRKGLTSSQSFHPDGIRTSPDDVREQAYDAVILCIPSTGLRGPWFEEFATATKDATVVSLTPGLEDREFIAEYVDETRLAIGLITAVSYPAPMPGESAPDPGTAYWLPPLTPAFFQGPKERLEPILNTLSEGGMRSRRISDVTERSSFGSALLIPLVAVLETAGWSLAELRGSRQRRTLLDDAADEALSAVETHLDSRRPLPTRMLGPTTWRGILMAAPIVPPFDLETYLQVHFTKVSDQTRMILDEYIECRRRSGDSSPALTKLREQIGDTPDGDKTSPPAEHVG